MLVEIFINILNVRDIEIRKMENKTNPYQEKIDEAVKYLKDKYPLTQRCKTAVVLGSGLDDFISQFKVEVEIPFKEIPNWKMGKVQGHFSKLTIGGLKDSPKTYVIVMQGRLHYYEGHSLFDVTFSVRVFKALGIENLILTNACGSLNPKYEKGDIVLINDHVNMTGVNPLIGMPFKPMFVAMDNCYDKSIRKSFNKIALELDIVTHESVYIGCSGPTFETRAEYKMFQLIGGDVCGMSTVPSNIVANQVNLKCIAVGIVANKGLNLVSSKAKHEDVLRDVRQALPNLCKILNKLLTILGK